MTGDHVASRRYARALFGLAGEKGLLDRIEKDFKTAVVLIGKHPEISHLVLNTTISIVEKEDFLDKIFGADVTTLFIQFIKVLIKKKRFAEFLLIREDFHAFYEKKMGIQEVQVITAVPLSGTLEKKLTETLTKKFRAEIRLLAEVKPDIIGGIILRFNSLEINASFRRHLTELEQKLTAS